MLSKKIMILIVSIVLWLWISAGYAGAVRAPDPVDSSIFNDIQKGGYILYFRHGEATIGEDQPFVDLNNCNTQRNLSLNGKKQASLLGEIFIKMNIPVYFPVISSPYCRARETAEIAFGRQNVVIEPSLQNIAKLSQTQITNEQKQNILSIFSKLIEKQPPRGTNFIIVGHSFPTGEALGDIPYMGAVVIKPKGPGKGYDFIMKISLIEFMKWSNLTDRR
ncbi:hypothetical protein BVG16_15285 [Paenibacillus selenitireducens]|uniref:Histidine phosphatase family protein n=1 Tax=Paenibacillus selenitireducens TaxID=1324314 RepID=A0A1T2XD84_9BACL|nr:histidine phosphatase family protein [Paenibacillus selenitireducens]OPA77788.1 hypothetical protein BVG16_15285 [Paenibacillus selenitireducens]